MTAHVTYTLGGIVLAESKTKKAIAILVILELKYLITVVLFYVYLHCIWVILIMGTRCVTVSTFSTCHGRLKVGSFESAVV